jgi:hypothetical protein
MYFFLLFLTLKSLKSANHTVTLVERDFGVILSNNLKWTSQIDKATNAAKAIIAQLRNSFTYFDAELVALCFAH